MGKILKTLGLALSVIMVLGFLQKRDPGRELPKREWLREAEKLEASVTALDEEALAHQRNLAKWYNYSLERGAEGLEDAYETILDFGGGKMAVLGIPEWELRIPVYHGGEKTVNHDPATPMPIGGRGDHPVLHLQESFPWEEGIYLYIDCLGQRLNYRVVSVQPEKVGMPPDVPEGEELLTLVFDREGTRTQVHCRRSGELVIRQEVSGANFPRAAPASALPLLILVWIWRGKWTAKAVRNGRIYGFCRKNRGKTKLF